MLRYQFIVGVSLPALEENLNRIAVSEPSLKLIQIMYVHGTGFVAVVERSDNAELNLNEEADQVKKTHRSSRKSLK